MIEILVVRDPESADDMTVWVDGVDVTNEAAFIYVDAGAGWDYEDWCESAAAHLAWPLSPKVFLAAQAAYDDPPGKQYIENWPEEDL